MFEDLVTDPKAVAAASGQPDAMPVNAEPIDSAQVTRWARALVEVDRRAGDAARIDQIRALEELKSAAAAAQAKLTADLAASQRRAQAEAGVPPSRHGRGVANQVALARRESPHRGNQHVGLAAILSTEMPYTMTALESGHLNEWRATLLVRETGCLSLQDRRLVDRAIAADTDTLDELGDRQLISQIRKLAYHLDPHAVAARARRAETERRVTTRPAPDTMAYVTALLPVAQAVAVQAALTRVADTLVATGDRRGRGQIMADTLVSRVTGQTEAAAVPAHIVLVMTTATLLGGDAEPAHLHGHGAIPAGLARDLVRNAAATEQAWLRRLFTRPGTGELVALDSPQRCFPRSLATLVGLRDQTCRTPWCDAPIRHVDHALAHAEHGATSSANGQGLCEQCNHAKQAPGWRARPTAGSRHTVETTTPTGHRYRSTAPRPPGTPRPQLDPQLDSPSRLEARWRDHVLAS